ncbi:hypothetical protein CR513_49752, partial [Mucuna pruriens]
MDRFDGTQDLHIHLQAFQTQFSTLPSRTICTFNDLAITFVSQFAANRAKKLEVTDLFDIKQMRGESLKKYLTRFNSATDQFFVKAFKKGLKPEQINNSLTLRRSASMGKSGPRQISTSRLRRI